jgi:hypothetical protein
MGASGNAKAGHKLSVATPATLSGVLGAAHRKTRLAARSVSFDWPVDFLYY